MDASFLYLQPILAVITTSTPTTLETTATILRGSSRRSWISSSICRSNGRAICVWTTPMCVRSCRYQQPVTTYGFSEDAQVVP